MAGMYKMQIIEINCPAGQTPVKFPDQPNLRNARIQQIIVHTTDTISKSPISYGTPMSITDLKNTFMTIQVGGEQRYQNKPALTFNPMAASAAYTNNPPQPENIIISWDKCFLTFGAAVSASVFVIEVWYDDRSGNMLNS